MGPHSKSKGEVDSQVEKRRPFYEGPPAELDLWNTRYMLDYVERVKPPSTGYQFINPYHSPYSQFTQLPQENLITKQQREQRLALQGLAQRDQIQSSSDTRICQQQPRPPLRQHQQRQRQQKLMPIEGRPIDDRFPYKLVYNFGLPVLAKPPLPGDITKPKVTRLRETHWKGVPLPFTDSRFEPMILSDRDSDFMHLTSDPFRYFTRKRKFPENNRCPHLPVTEEAYLFEEPAGNWICMRGSKFRGHRWPKKRFPRPPEYFITSLW